MNQISSLLQRCSKVIDTFSELTGRFITWLTLLMVLLVFIVVVMRYVFNFGSIALQESIIYLHGLVFLIGAAYTLKEDEHVRVDIFYNRQSKRYKAWINLSGTLIFLLPVCIYIFFMSLDYVLLSWRIDEASSEAGGLPGLYLLKSLILIMPLLLIIQGIAVILKSILLLVFKIEEESHHSEAGL